MLPAVFLAVEKTERRREEGREVEVEDVVECEYGRESLGLIIEKENVEEMDIVVCCV